MKNHVIIHAKEPYFQKNKDKFQEMLNNVKKMKNIMHNLDNSDIICKNNTNLKKSLCSRKRTDFSSKSGKKITKKKNSIIEKSQMNNDFIINDHQFFNDDYYIEWPNSLNSLNSLNDIMSSTADYSLKEENNNKENNLINFENKNLSFQKMPYLEEKEIDFSLNNKLNIFNLNFNNCDEKNNDDINEDFSSKMTNLYIQEYDDKKLANDLLV